MQAMIHTYMNRPTIAKPPTNGTEPRPPNKKPRHDPKIMAGHRIAII
jgi:hypothetical protein